MLLNFLGKAVRCGTVMSRAPSFLFFFLSLSSSLRFASDKNGIIPRDAVEGPEK